jgi:uncharacterized membrane protein YphA (DoxX/SURF4 family)
MAMDNSMAQPRAQFAPLVMPGWKTAAGWTSAVVLAIIFLAAGLFKITDTQTAAVLMHQARVPEHLSVPAAVLFGIAETVSGILILLPRFRRWGAISTGVLLTAFITYIGINYSALHGQDCSCFPWLKRAVGPAFFAEDGAMLLLAVLAGMWSKAASGLRTGLLILAAVTVFAGVSYGVNAVRATGTKAPDSITVAGQPYSLQKGKIFVFFFNPECLHCLDAATRMAHYNWGDTRVVAIPTQEPQFGPGFLQRTKLNAALSNDLEPLKTVFPFVNAPAGVALENGREKAPITKFEDQEPGVTLKQLGFVK